MGDMGIKYDCVNEVCFKDTPLKPKSERFRNYDNIEMNKYNKCEYFEVESMERSLILSLFKKIFKGD